MENRRQGSNPSAEEDIHAAARTGDVQKLQSISATNPLAVNSRDKHSRTPNIQYQHFGAGKYLWLHLAAWAGQTEAVNFLCKNKADAGAAAMDDMGAIHFASQKGHLEVVRILLSCGVSVKASNRKGFTALHYAAQGSHLDLVKYLVRKGASLTTRTKAGKTPIDLAAGEEVRSFLEEWEASAKKPKETAVSKEVEEDLPNESPKDRAKDDGVECRADDEDGIETKKRKAEETESKERLPVVAKKTKVALNHLLAANDMEEEEE
ncbi:hypothetical protein ACLOJK_039926 [Asimina triloba]